MIRNVVFDMGNVVILFDPALFMDREGIPDPRDRKLIMNELFTSVEWARMDRGELTEETAAPSVLSRIPEGLREQARRLLFSWSDPKDQFPGAESLIRRLKSAGYRLYLLSNASRAQHEYWPGYAVSGLFNGTMISADLGLIKPMPGIYREFTKRFSLVPQECLFIDDMPMNVAAALAEGWDGIVFHGDYAELERSLRAHGVTAAPES